MEFTFFILLFVLVTIVILFLVIFNVLNDFRLPTNQVIATNILFIYPHPDDEVLTVGGLIAKMSNKNNVKTTLICLTKGENYTHNPSESIKRIRSEELKISSKSLGVKDLINLDLGDGRLNINKEILEKELEDLVSKVKPDLIVTYEPSGLYGHPDHMITTKICMQIAQNHGVKIMYSCIPDKLNNMAKMPVEMAKEDFRKKRISPNFAVSLNIRELMAKTKALYAHKSQLNSFKKNFPKFLPLWIFVILSVREYYFDPTVQS